MPIQPEERKAIEQKYGIDFEIWNYTIHIDDKRKIAYFETPKVACTSIKKYMIDKCDNRVVDFAIKGDIHYRETSPLKQLHKFDSHARDAVWGPEYTRFTFCRNPYSRCLSAYLDKLVTNEWERNMHLPIFGFSQDARPSFGEFLECLADIPDEARDIHYMTQKRLVGGIGELPLSFVGRFENFADDFTALKREYYNDNATDNYESFGKHHAANANSKLLQFYRDREISLVREIYASDFDYFDYSSDIGLAANP